jgi:ABC-type bacteriocin/lantibiotic exporter with double-glycine peptidase domain
VRHIAILFAVAGAGLGGCLAQDPGAHAVTAGQLDATWLRAASTPVVVQSSDRDCGAAALAMVAGAWGKHWTLATIERAVPPTEAGIQLGALRDLARASGLDAYAVRGTRADLEHELAAGRPVVLGLIEPVDRRRNRSHYEVAIALDPRSGDVVTIDPATGDLERRVAAVLDLEWKTAGYATLVVVADRTAQASN